MYEYQDLDYGYVIITPENNPDFVKITVGSIKNIFPYAKIIAITRNDIDHVAENKIKQICPVFKGENTYTSLITEGIKNPPSEWNLHVMAGTHFENKIQKKLKFLFQQ